MLYNKIKTSVTLFAILFLSSCATTKYQELGFGGGNGSFAAKKLESKSGIKEKNDAHDHESLRVESSATDKTNANEIIQNRSTISKLIEKKVAKIEKIAVKISENRYPFISHSHIQIQKNLNSKQSIGKSEDQPIKSKWPNSKSSFGKWILTILGIPIFLIGSILVLVGIFDRLLGGEITIYIGLTITFIGYLILLWSWKIS